MDAAGINQRCDLVTLVARDTSLRRSGAYYFGPCPFCGGVDRFTVKRTPQGDRWHCRKCVDDGYHTGIDYVMRRDQVDFATALADLGRQDASVAIRQPVVSVERTGLALPDSEWQVAAQREIDTASDRLLTGAGSAGRDYLARRGLHRGTWLAWQLGFRYVYDPSIRQARPAIVLPWLDFDLACEVVMAVKYRFVDHEPAGLRYMCRRGSVPVLFGLLAVMPSHQILLLVEGEINALSVWQCMPAGVTCASFGSEAGGHAGILKALARRYRQVVAWADDAPRSLEIRASLGGTAEALQSPRRDGVKLDANMMLQHGLLMDFLSELLQVRCLGRHATPELGATDSVNTLLALGRERAV